MVGSHGVGLGSWDPYNLDLGVGRGAGQASCAKGLAGLQVQLPPPAPIPPRPFPPQVVLHARSTPHPYPPPLQGAPVKCTGVSWLGFGILVP